MEIMKQDWASTRTVILETGIASIDEVVKRHLPIFKEGHGSIKYLKGGYTSDRRRHQFSDKFAYRSHDVKCGR